MNRAEHLRQRGAALEHDMRRAGLDLEDAGERSANPEVLQGTAASQTHQRHAHTVRGTQIEEVERRVHAQRVGFAGRGDAPA